VKINELFTQKRVVFSFEVFPPKRDGSIQTIYETLNGLKDLHPDFISVTYGAGGNMADNATCEIASTIKHDYHIEPLAHLTCVNSSREEIFRLLERLKESGIENILALRGDRIEGQAETSDFKHASDLVKVVRDFGGFNIVGACYPESHPESIDLESDIENLKHKVDAGTTHLITQLFFDNADYYAFVEKAAKTGINIPIQAGIMPVVNKKQIERMVSLCGASLPKKLVKILSHYEHSPAALMDAGISYATDQIIDLISDGVPGIHLYTMNNPTVARRVSESITNIRDCVNEKGSTQKSEE